MYYTKIGHQSPTLYYTTYLKIPPIEKYTYVYIGLYLEIVGVL